MTCSNSDVMVTGFKPSEDGKAWIVRLFGAAGHDTSTKLQWNGSQPRALWRTDNSEHPIEPLSGDTIDVPAYGIVSIRAELP